MKKLLLLVLIVMQAGVINARAEEVSFYSNEFGLSLSEEEYVELCEFVDENVIDTLNEEEYQYIINNNDRDISEISVTYVKTEYVEKNGELNAVSEEYLTEEEMIDTMNDRNVSLLSLEDRQDTCQTAMKKITLSLTMVQASTKRAVLDCVWISIPQNKSFDVLAFRVPQTSVTIDTNYTNNVIGYQKYDGNTITYYHTNGNFKVCDNGIGLSMNIVDSVSESLECKLIVTFASNKDPFAVYGTYQHSVKSVTLSQSQDYTIMATGMGNVLAFDSDVYDLYDKTPGLFVFGSLDDE